jgi:hypothetical protein
MRERERGGEDRNVVYLILMKKKVLLEAQSGERERERERPGHSKLINVQIKLSCIKLQKLFL